MQKILLSDATNSFDLQNSPETDEVRKYLTVETPEGLEVERIQIQRSRRVPIRWDHLIGQGKPFAFATVNDGRPFGHLKRYMQRLWFGPDQFGTNPFRDLTIDEVQAIQGGVSKPANFSGVSVNLQNPTNGYNIVHALHAREGLSIELNDFDTPASFNDLWEKVDFITDDTEQSTYVEILDLAPLKLIPELEAIETAAAAAGKLSSNADDLIDSAASSVSQSSDIDTLLNTDRRLRGPQSAWNLRVQELARLAGSLGFSFNALFELSLDFYYSASWQVKINRPRIRSKVVEVSVAGDRIIEYEFEVPRLCSFQRTRVPVQTPGGIGYSSWGVPGENEYQFQRVGAEYLTQFDCRWEDAVYEDYRRWTDTNWLPLYDDDESGESIALKYMKCEASHPAATCMRTPRIFIQEVNSIVASPPKVVLGELVATVNLAPGEERELTFETRTTKETERTQNATSSLELGNETSREFTSEFERELRRSSESVSRSNWNAKASGGFFGVRASAGGGGSRSSSRKDFDKSLKKTIGRTAQKVTRNTKRELSNSASVRTTTSTQETVSVKIRNVNEGRTFNLAFYNLLNKRDFSLKLDEIRFLLDPGVQAIEGLPHTLPREFGIGQLDDLLDSVDMSAMPVGNPQPNAHTRLKRDLSLSIITALEDYTSAEDPPITVPDLATAKELLEDDTEPLENGLRAFRSSLARIVYNEVSETLEENVVVGSPGLYADSIIGARSATEPYAEWMRLKEVETKEAQVEKDLGMARAFNASASRAGNLAPFNVNPTALSDQRLRLQFTAQPSLGDWKLLVDGNLEKTFTIEEGMTTIEIDFAEPQDWLGAQGVNYARIQKVDGNEEVAFFVV